MSEQYLADRFTEGVWFHEQAEEFVVPEENNGSIVFRNADTEEVEFKVDGEDFVEVEQDYLTRVPDRAVEDPVSVVENQLSVFVEDITDLTGDQYKDRLAVRYARNHVEFSEK